MLFYLLHYFLSIHLGIVSLKDVVEILFFVLLIRYFLVWLRKDQTKPLFFYGCTTFGIMSLLLWLPLPTINLFLFLYTPSFVLIVIILHQEFLQKNMVSFKTLKSPLITVKESWIDDLLKSSLCAYNKNKQSIFIIECKQALDYYVQPTIVFNTQLNEMLMQLVLQSPLFNEKLPCYITCEGILKGCNVILKIKNILSPDESNSNNLLSKFMHLTKNTDAIIIIKNAQEHGFTIIAGESLVQNLSSIATKTIIKNYLKKTDTFKQATKELVYDHSHNKNSFKQHFT